MPFPGSAVECRRGEGSLHCLLPGSYDPCGSVALSHLPLGLMLKWLRCMGRAKHCIGKQPKCVLAARGQSREHDGAFTHHARVKALADPHLLRDCGDALHGTMPHEQRMPSRFRTVEIRNHVLTLEGIVWGPAMLSIALLLALLARLRSRFRSRLRSVRLRPQNLGGTNMSSFSSRSRTTKRPHRKSKSKGTIVSGVVR